MDTKTLVVGQSVDMVSGCYGCRGKVVEIKLSGVIHVICEGPPWGLLHFDSEGKGFDYEGTFECGPWFLTEKK